MACSQDRRPPTQLSFWQLSDSAFSSPFRDTNDEPEGFITYRNNYDLGLLNLRIISLGLVHQSNGRARPLSRSWNRLFAEFGLEKVFNKKKRHEFDLFVKGWYRIPEDSPGDDNPDIEKFMGNMEIRGVYYWNNISLSMMLRNNLRTPENKGALQLDGIFPFPKFPEWFPFLGKERIRNSLKFYVQYFTGYGECLLNYNSSSNRFGLGLTVTNW